MRNRPCLVALMVGGFSLGACDKPAAQELQALEGDVGSVKGIFKLRLAPNYRAKLDALTSQVSNLFPGVGASLVQRFAGVDQATDAAGTKLSDLLKLSVPLTVDETANKLIFQQLQKVDLGLGPAFAAVDTEKFVGGKLYAAASGESADPLMAQQYYLDMIEWTAAVATVSPAQLAAAAPVVVAVLDTGVDGTHEDLAASMWRGPADAFGYDATSTTTWTSEDQVTDQNGHGTNVAGIIAAVGDNGKGVHGISYVGQPLAKIMPVKVLDDSGAGTTDSITAGIKWAVDQHEEQRQSTPTQKLIINMSLGGPFEAAGYNYPKDPTSGNYTFEDDLLNYATQNPDVLVVVAAGNDSCGISGACSVANQSFEETYYYPCSYDHVLCVAASTDGDTLAGFSDRLGSVGITAPGYQILSTVPTTPDGGAGPYQYYSGTSQATPVVAGAAAVLWSLYPSFSAEQIKLIIQKTGSKVSDITSQVQSGNGRLDLRAALAYAAQLTAASTTPSKQEPATALVSTAKITPATPPPSSGIDPNAPAADSAAPEQAGTGKGSGGGCAVVGGTTAAQARALLLLGLMAPLAALAGRRRA